MRKVYEISIVIGDLDKRGSWVDSYDYEQYETYSEALKVFNEATSIKDEVTAFQINENVYDEDGDLHSSELIIERSV